MLPEWWLSNSGQMAQREPEYSNICEKPTVFKKLEVQTPIPDTKAAVIIRLGSATVEVNEGTSQQTIQAVLLALQSIC